MRFKIGLFLLPYFFCITALKAQAQADTLSLNFQDAEKHFLDNNLSLLAQKYNIDAFAIGDGTAGRETEKFVRSIDFGRQIPLFMVNEDGASVYSASEVAREEFPSEDVTVRGAISTAPASGLGRSSPSSWRAASVRP